MYDVAVVGGGIIGLATARAVLRRFPQVQLVLLEKEHGLASHQSGRNSGVIHSGIYYRPGSLKARLCVSGGLALTAFCDTHRIRYHRCGKIIVAVEPTELPALHALYDRGVANGVPGLSRVGQGELRDLEPHVQGIEALRLSEVAIVDFVEVARALAEEITRSGGTILTSTRLRSLRRQPAGWQLETTRGSYHARFLVNCGGLHADRVARQAGDRSPVRIIPFRGEYYALAPSRASLVNGLVYPVPDPTMPFLGIHFTKTLDGGVHVGPNAVVALKREGYTRTDVSLRDCLELITHPGFWGMVGRHWKTGIQEMVRSWSRPAFLRAAQRLIPTLKADDLLPSPAGVRAQAVDGDGALLDDFVLRESAQALHVYNAPSPAATASLSIGEALAARLARPLSERSASLAIPEGTC